MPINFKFLTTEDTEDTEKRKMILCFVRPPQKQMVKTNISVFSVSSVVKIHSLQN